MGETKYDWTDKTKTGLSKEEFDALWTAVNAIPVAYDIDDLDDVVIAAPADHELLAWDTGTSKWINMTPTEAGLDAIYEALGHDHDGDYSALGHDHDADYLQLSGGTITGDLTLSSGKLNIGAATELTLDASGLVTVTRTRHHIDTFEDAGADDLVSIASSGGTTDGDILILQNMIGSRTVTVKDNVGNIQMAGDFALTNPRDTLTLMFDAFSNKWIELSRSNNA